MTMLVLLIYSVRYGDITWLIEMLLQFWSFHRQQHHDISESHSFCHFGLRSFYPASSVQRGWQVFNHVVLHVVFKERSVVPCHSRRRSMSCHLVLFFAYHLVAMRMLNQSSYEGLEKSRERILAVGFGKGQSRNSWCWHTSLILWLFLAKNE